jgi:hypothetical protein
MEHAKIAMIGIFILELYVSLEAGNCSLAIMNPAWYLAITRYSSFLTRSKQLTHCMCLQDDSSGGDVEITDVRASLILNLLLQAVDYPAPNLTHLLLGFNVVEGPQGTRLFLRPP